MALADFLKRPATTHTAAGAGGAVAGGAIVLAMAAQLIAPFEGERTKTYKDIVGVETVCDGETAKWATDEGKRRAFTHTECLDMLAKSLPKYDDGIKACVHRDMPRSVHVAFISVTYNIGVGGFCHSTMARRANAGDWAGACDALLGWNRAGGRVIGGLDKRRRAERDTCKKDLT